MATREQLQEFVCGHGCVLDLKRGMGTNGPCRHMQYPRHLSDEDRRVWRGLVEATRVHRRRAEELEAENARLRTVGQRLRDISAAANRLVAGTGITQGDIDDAIIECIERRFRELEAENARLREAGGQLRAYFDTDRIHYESSIREMCERWDAAAKESGR